MTTPLLDGLSPVVDLDTGLRRLEQLVGPQTGLVGRVQQYPANPGLPSFAIYAAELGDPGEALPGVALSARGRSIRGDMDGAGGGLDHDHAALTAVAEALERYASCTWSEEQFIWARAQELGEDALDLHLVPRCSERELEHPRCPLVAPDPSAPIRWVRGVDLHNGRPRWVPAQLVYLHLPFLSRGERFTLPISTGCAAHTNLAAALRNAICEVIERDALSLTWLQMLPLPRLELDRVPEELAAVLARCADTDAQIHLFDATTDLGVPTVYGLETATANGSVATVAMAATDLDPARAATKAIREAESCRMALESRPEAGSQDPDEFIGVFEGAAYMGAPERRSAFDFLLQGTETRALSELAVRASSDPAEELRWLLGQLQASGMDAVAVDLTTDEAKRVGFRVVRVVVPQLQPLSFSYRARFLAHPRLYSAPPAMGYRSRPESDLNPWPQPFA